MFFILLYLTSCDNEKEIKITRNIYLLQQEGNVNSGYSGYNVCVKEDENTYRPLIQEDVIKIFYNEKDIFIESVFAPNRDTNYYEFLLRKDTLKDLWSW